MMFHDRTAAGRKLADALTQYSHHRAAVFALPRGGVVVGHEVARKLGVPLDCVIARKIGHPHDPEYAIAAVTEDGTLVANQAEVAAVDPEWFRKEVEAQKQEARRRRAVYCGGRTPVSAEGIIAIVVDDGIATGLTIKAALRTLNHQKPEKLVVAVPVAPADVVSELRMYADEVIALEAARFFRGGVGAYYGSFPQVSDEEVIAIMKQYQ